MSSSSVQALSPKAALLTAGVAYSTYLLTSKIGSIINSALEKRSNLYWAAYWDSPLVFQVVRHSIEVAKLEAVLAVSSLVSRKWGFEIRLPRPWGVIAASYGAYLLTDRVCTVVDARMRFTDVGKWYKPYSISQYIFELMRLGIPLYTGAGAARAWGAQLPWVLVAQWAASIFVAKKAMDIVLHVTHHLVSIPIQLDWRFKKPCETITQLGLEQEERVQTYLRLQGEVQDLNRVWASFHDRLNLYETDIEIIVGKYRDTQGRLNIYGFFKTHDAQIKVFMEAGDVNKSLYSTEVQEAIARLQPRYQAYKDEMEKAKQWLDKNWYPFVHRRNTAIAEFEKPVSANLLQKKRDLITALEQVDLALGTMDFSTILSLLVASVYNLLPRTNSLMAFKDYLSRCESKNTLPDSVDSSRAWFENKAAKYLETIMRSIICLKIIENGAQLLKDLK